MNRRPNILLIVSDEERRNGWLHDMVDMPAHERLRRSSLTFERHYTHTSPCSPSRASLFTGLYLSRHGVVDNVNFPSHHALDPEIPTLGSLLRAEGYESAYLGKWHLEATGTPDLEAHGYSGWHGNDRHYMGGAGTGREFDPVIAEQAVEWLHHDAPTDRPWFLTVSLVNPHDIMWYPVDQPWYQAEHPDEAEILRAVQSVWLEGVEPPPLDADYPRRFSELPANFDDDLHTKPEIQRMWRWVRNTEHFVGSMDPTDTALWLRQLDYYAYLHERLDESLSTILAELDRQAMFDDTAIIYTSDHGDACGSHGLRAKLPCVYEEVMGVPLTVQVPGMTTAGASTDALSTHVDLAATIASLGGVSTRERESLSGVDLSGVLHDPAISARDHVLFAQDSAQSELLRNSRYAVSGFFDGTDKYARYYGVGGGVQRDGTAAEAAKVFGPDAAFDDQDHEWYRVGDDPHELENRAHDRAQRRRVRELYEHLRDLEREDYAFDQG